MKAIKPIITDSEMGDDENERVLKGFKWLELFSDKPVHRRGTLLDTLCATLEEKMQYEEGERDMVILQHKFEIELKDGTRVRIIKIVLLLYYGPLLELYQPVITKS
jgi:saccharopine dehydrogenase (NADP+, L-glutamate forming)